MGVQDQLDAAHEAYSRRYFVGGCADAKKRVNASGLSALKGEEVPHSPPCTFTARGWPLLCFRLVILRVPGLHFAAPPCRAVADDEHAMSVRINVCACRWWFGGTRKGRDSGAALSLALWTKSTSDAGACT